MKNTRQTDGKGKEWCTIDASFDYPAKKGSIKRDTKRLVREAHLKIDFSLSKNCTRHLPRSKVNSRRLPHSSPCPGLIFPMSHALPMAEKHCFELAQGHWTRWRML